jgi:hypothetical protein
MKFVTDRLFADLDAGARNRKRVRAGAGRSDMRLRFMTLFPPSEIGHRWPLRATSDS